MRTETLPIGQYEENSYILHDQKQVLFIDPGRYAQELIRHVEKDEQVQAILLTHGHADHTGAVDDLVDVYHCPVFLHPEDRPLVDPDSPRSGGVEKPVYSPIRDLTEGHHTFGVFETEILHTPGHTPGSVLIRLGQLLFTGDTLFALSIGRTDFFGGSDEDMQASLRKICQLPNDLQIYPGHGQASTIGHEKKFNPWLQALE